jgi:hypothetical protein
MNKQHWLREAIAHIDSLNTQEFENFLLGCIPHHVVKTAYNEIKHGKFISISGTEAANMDSYYTDSISIAA